MRKGILPWLLAGVWVSFSEFLRNQIIFKYYWVEHYHVLGLKFQTLPINGVLWMIWSFLFAWLIQQWLAKYSFWRVFLMAWLAGFAMMWMVLYNLQVLPLGLLIAAVPLSLLEVYLAQVILRAVK